MDKPLVSVIMPAYNAELYIGEAIESVVNQTFRNWELIIINDGSTDATEKIILDFERKDKRIKYLFQENGKQGKARNLGIQQSRGEYIAFLDADDLWVAQKLEVQSKLLYNNPETSLIFSNGYAMIGDNVQIFPIEVKNTWTKDDIPLFIQNNRIPILSVIVKKVALLSVRGFSEAKEIQNVEDYHLWLKLLFNGFEFMSIENPLFIYRVHPLQSTFDGSNTANPIVNMFINLRDQWQTNRYDIPLIKRLKWFLFDHEIGDYFNCFLCLLLSSSRPVSVRLFKTISNLNIGKVRQKLLFHLCP